MKDIEFGKRLKYLRKLRGLVQTDAAARIGVSYKALQNHESGNWPNRTNLEKYIKFYGCNRDWLLTGKGEPFPHKHPEVPRAEPSITFVAEDSFGRGEYILIPQLEGRVTAGPDGGILFDKPDDLYPFKKWWIVRKVGSSKERHKALVLVRVQGESMIPTIYPGEMILVDTWEAERVDIIDGKIYLVRMPDGAITVKRIILKKNDVACLVCISDNQSFEPFKFKLDHPIQWYVLGRVRWVGRELD